GPVLLMSPDGGWRPRARCRTPDARATVSPGISPTLPPQATRPAPISPAAPPTAPMPLAPATAAAVLQPPVPETIPEDPPATSNYRFFCSLIGVPANVHT